MCKGRFGMPGRIFAPRYGNSDRNFLESPSSALDSENETCPMGWRRNRKKQRQKDRRSKSRRPDRAERVAAFKQRELDRPGPLMAERQARIAAAAQMPPAAAQDSPGRDIPAPGAQTVESRNGAAGPAIATPQQQGVQGDSGIGQPQTALFESRGATRSDTGLVTRAIRKRWETDKRMSEAILTKIGLKALQDEKLTMPQLLGAGKLMLDVERQNQAEEHHAERMDYAERALAHRVMTSGSPVPTVGVGVRMTTADGQAADVGVQIYVPDNGREERAEPIVDEIIANP